MAALLWLYLWHLDPSDASLSSSFPSVVHVQLLPEWLMKVRFDTPVEVWDSLDKVPSTLRPRDGRSVLISMDLDRFETLRSDPNLSRLTKSYRSLELFIFANGSFDASRFEPVLTSKIIIWQRLAKAKYGKILFCPGDKTPRSMVMAKEVFRDTSEGCFKDRSNILDIDGHVIGSRPAVIRKSVIDPTGYRVDLMRIFFQHLGFKANWVLDSNYNQVVRAVSTTKKMAMMTLMIAIYQFRLATPLCPPA